MSLQNTWSLERQTHILLHADWRGQPWIGRRQMKLPSSCKRYSREVSGLCKIWLIALQSLSFPHYPVPFAHPAVPPPTAIDKECWIPFFASQR